MYPSGLKTVYEMHACYVSFVLQGGGGVKDKRLMCERNNSAKRIYLTLLEYAISTLIHHVRMTHRPAATVRTKCDSRSYNIIVIFDVRIIIIIYARERTIQRTFS